MRVSTSQCQNCGNPLPSNASATICPACLIADALEPLDASLEESRGNGAPPPPGCPDPLEGTTLGPGGRYKILQRIGEGGFGTVFMAEQTAPVRRPVAIKILKAGMDTRQVVARFEAERQALAMMDHPNIAKVLDGGETELGRPFFVMELVRGTPITTFCDREKLDTPTRLRLFVQVCRAVQHAHQKGIIHRDLKPGNILVTMEDGAEPVPKVIDFGVAKAMESNLTDKTLFTRFEQMIGTPAYMSPEQAGTDAAANDIDTRADIYCLGVLLYELLTGSTPFTSETLQNPAFEEVRRILREEEAPKPSARLSSLEASRRQTLAHARNTASPQTLDRQLRGDLDWIVMRAIEKDRRRRYETANALALDLERFLDDQPVSAGPPTAAYRAAKFLRRHKISLAVAATIALLLITGTAISTWQAVLANQRLAEAEAISTFLTTMIDRATPDGPNSTTVTFAEALKQAETRLANDPDIPTHRRAVLQHAIGNFTQAVEVRDEITLLRNIGQFYTETYGPDSSKATYALRDLASALFKAGYHDEALELREKALDIHLKGIAKDERPLNYLTLDLMWFVIESYQTAGRTDDEIEWRKKRIELIRNLYGSNHMKVRQRLFALASRLKEENRHEEAAEVHHQLVSIQKQEFDAKTATLRENHPDWIREALNLVDVYQAADHHDEAAALLTALIQRATAEIGSQHDVVRDFSRKLSISYRATGRHGEADLLEGTRPRVTDDAPTVTSTLVEPSSTWSWIHPLDGTDPAASDPDFHQTFALPNFDDATWHTGTDSPEPTGGFGYGDDELTVVDIGTPQSKELGKSAYFRHRFTTDRALTRLELRCRYDDGLIVYVDGTEVARVNVVAGDDAYRLPAYWTVKQKEKNDLIRLPLHDFKLPPGDHVLAISVHNTEGPSSDLRIGSISLVAVE